VSARGIHAVRRASRISLAAAGADTLATRPTAVAAVELDVPNIDGRHASLVGLLPNWAAVRDGRRAHPRREWQ
jgi:hypothetical protein